MPATSTMEDTQVSTVCQEPYESSCIKYEQKADRASAAIRTIIVTGYGCKLSIDKGALVVKQGCTHDNQDSKPTILYPGTHSIKNIILLDCTGNITIDAIDWCCRHEVCIMMLDQDGSLLQVLTPEHASNAVLRRKQYNACPLPIVNWLLRAKTSEQVRTLRNHPELDSSKLKNLQRAAASEFMFNDVQLLMTEEGRLRRRLLFSFH